MKSKFHTSLSVILSERDVKQWTYRKSREVDVLSDFLYNVSKNWNFKVDLADPCAATVSGVCTEDEIALLSGQVREFLSSHGIKNGVDRWEIKRGRRVAQMHTITQETSKKCSKLQLEACFHENWADMQQMSPAQAFFELLCQKLDLSMDMPAESPAYLTLTLYTFIPVLTVWGTGQAALKELGLMPHLADFTVRMLPGNEDEW